MRKHVLVTGGAGYVGSLLVEELLRRGHRVRVLDALVHGIVPSVLTAWGNPSFEFIRGDVRDAGARAVALEGGRLGRPSCGDRRRPRLRARTRARAGRQPRGDASSWSTTQHARASSGSSSRRPAATMASATTDRSPRRKIELKPVSLYAETKVAAELDILSRNGAGPRVSTCLRFATVYGTSPRMRFDLTVNEFTRDLAARERAGRLRRAVLAALRPRARRRRCDRACCSRQRPRPSRARSSTSGDTHENYRKLDIVDLLNDRSRRGEVEVRAQRRGPARLPRQLREARRLDRFQTRRQRRLRDRRGCLARAHERRRSRRPGLPQLALSSRESPGRPRQCLGQCATEASSA